MRIYTEVVMQWDESKGKLVEISSESYEHKGEVALAATDPYDWTAAFPARRSPGVVSTYGTTTGVPLDVLPSGSQIQGIDEIYKQSLYDIIHQYDDTVYLTGKETKREKAHDQFKYGRWGHPSWAEGWYDPAFESVVRAPAASILGMSGQGLGDAQSLVKPEASPLIGLQEAFGDRPIPQHLQGYQPGPATQQLGRGPLIHEDVKTDIQSAIAGLEIGRTAHEELLEGFETERGEAKDVQKEGLLEQKIARSKALAGRPQEYEAARAAQAATGMSYSAPAEAVLTETQEEGVEELTDIKLGEREVREDYDEAIKGIEGRERAEEIAWTGQQTDIEGEFQSAFEESDRLLGDFASAGASLLEGWQSMFYGDKGVNKRYGGGYKRMGGHFFGEAGHDVSGVAPEVGLISQVGQEAQDYGQWLTDMSYGAVDQLLAGLGEGEV